MPHLQMRNFGKKNEHILAYLDIYCMKVKDQVLAEPFSYPQCIILRSTIYFF